MKGMMKDTDKAGELGGERAKTRLAPALSGLGAMLSRKRFRVEDLRVKGECMGSMHSRTASPNVLALSIPFSSDMRKLSAL